MKERLTKVSQEAFERIAAGGLSPTEAANYLLNERPCITRGFGETVISMFGDKDLALTRIRSFYLELDPTSNKDSVTRTIRNWLNDCNSPKYREDIFRIAYALDLTEAQLSYLLALDDGYAIQYRDGRELVLSWFLRMGQTYRDAIAFFESLPSYDPNNNMDSLRCSTITHAIARDIHVLTDEEALRSYYVEHLHEFGTQHARAYHYFDRYLSALIQPDSSMVGSSEEAPIEDAYPIETVIDNYMTLGIRRNRSNKDLAPVLVLIKKNWPNKQYISSFRTHERDVPRKVILLLYVITENIGIEGDGNQRPEHEHNASFEERLYDHITIIDSILRDCGMAELDMRNAFDWLILYAVSAELDDEAMSKRFEDVVCRLYPDSKME